MKINLMKTEIPLYQFASDLRTLYLKTGESSIEDLFVQAAMVGEAGFMDWLSQNESVQTKLGSPAVYPALMALVDIHRSMPNVNPGELVTYLHKKNYLGYVSTFLAFQQLLGSEVGPLLSPFANILTALAPFSSNVPDNVDAVKSDLSIINTEYEQSEEDVYEDHIPIVKTKSTRKEKRRMLFKYLISSFSNEMADGLQQLGQDDLSSKIRTEGLLMRTSDLAKEAFAKVDFSRKKIAETIFKKHLRPANAVDKNFELIYDNLKNDIMASALLVSPKELERY